ncbi:MAG: hypothetical protein ACR2N0_08685 [Rubrobacteraceae bacterium]
MMREETAPVAMLDAAGTMTASGILALYLVLNPVVSAVEFDGWGDLSWILSRPVCDLGFLFPPVPSDPRSTRRPDCRRD